MMPGLVHSTRAIYAPTLYPVKRVGEIDWGIGYEMAGTAIANASDGLEVKIWTIRRVEEPETELQRVMLSAPGVSEFELFNGPDITEIDIAFDQNMQPFVTYLQAGQAKYYWFDGTIPGFVHVNLPSDARSPRCTIDDHRPLQTGVSDIVLMYIRGSTLYMRQQRDRFLIEYNIAEVGSQAELVYVCMNVKWRLQWYLHKAEVEEDDQYRMITDPFLGDVVNDLCRRAGVRAENIDVSELYDDQVGGYIIDRDEGMDTFLKPLSQLFFFDPTEYDRQIHFYKRGRDPVVGIHYTELVAAERSLDPMQTKVIDTLKLPKTVNLSYIDPSGAWAKNKQFAERKSNQIKTKANMNLETSLVLSADQAATVALTALKVAWYELAEYSFALPIAYSRLVPGDVINFFAKDGSTQRIRLSSKNEDGNILRFEGKQDGGLDVYDTIATGLVLPYPESTTPGLIGATRLEILNLPALRDEDDELGVYIAIAGTSEAWYGAAVLYSTDGVSYLEAFRGEIPATLGETVTALADETSPEYPSDQELTVTSNFPLSTVSDAELYNNANLAVVGDELIQFGTAIALGEDTDGNALWRLSRILRGRYNTEIEPWAAGTRFVVMDASVTFVRAQTWMLGHEIWFKPVSFGVNEDESVPTSYEFDTAYSQREWDPHNVNAIRGDYDEVVVTWIPRPRLGVGTAPRNSKYFTGYRVEFDDGQTTTTTEKTYTRASCPLGVQVRIVPLNSITGDGEATAYVPINESP